MRRWADRLALVAALGAGSPAFAHLIAAPADLDAWLASGSATGLARARGAPEPCGTEPFPAVQRLELTEVWRGALAPGSIEVLVPDDHAPRVPAGSPGLVVFGEVRAAEAPECSAVPRVRLEGPWEVAEDVSADADGWRRYVAGLSNLPPDGPGRYEGLLALWTAAVASPADRLARFAARRLGSAPALPAGLTAELTALASDENALDEARARAIALAGERFDPVLLGRLASSPSLVVAEPAIAVLLLADGATHVYAGAPVSETWKALVGAAGERPVDEIRRVGLAAVLAALGDDRGRGTLEAGLHSRLFKSRRYATLGLGRLAAAGDVGAREALVRRREVEPDARIAEVIDAELGIEEATPMDRVPVAGPGRRMLLVLLGLLALMGMLIIPLFVRRGAGGANPV